METIRPKKLPQRDAKIGLVAPSSAINTRFVALGIKEISERYDVTFKLGRSVNRMIETDLTAASVEVRANDINQMFADPEIDAIMAARGGYGSQELINHLDYDVIKDNPKPIVGFSDVTAILNAITVKTGMITFLGPTCEIPRMSDAERANLDFLFEMWREPNPQMLLQMKSSLNIVRAIETQKKIGSGRLFGGNMVLTTRLIGTPFEVPSSDVVLAFEEIGESPISVDGMLHHLQLCGILNRNVPVLFGDFVRNRSASGGSLSQEDSNPSINLILINRLKNQNAPVLAGFPFSHGEYNLTLPIGAKVRADASISSVTVLEPVVQ